MAQPQLELHADKREVFGRKVKQLRRAAKLPANIYGKKVKSLAVTVGMKDFEKVFKEAGETTIINLRVAKEKSLRPVLVANPQKDPLTDAPVHVDFHQVDLTQKVTVAVPIEIRGQSPAVKEKGAVLIRLLDELEVEALPQDLPDMIKIDISGLVEFDQSVLVKDLKLDSQLTVLADPEEAVVMVQEPKKEEEAPPPTPEVVPAEAEAVEVEEPEAQAKEVPEKKKEKDQEEGKDN